MRLRHFIALATALLGASSLSGCGALPEAGPSTDAIANGGHTVASNATVESVGGYTLVNLSESIAMKLAAEMGNPSANPYATLPRPRKPGLIGVGDLLAITSWEPNPTGQTLFAQPAYNLTVRVGPGGRIALPYLPPVSANGVSSNALALKIEQGYKSSGHDVQVAVYDKSLLNDTVSLQGDLDKPGSYPLVSSQDRLLDVLADAGGPARKKVGADVRITRGTVVASAPYYEVLRDRTLNVRLSPGDQITVLPHRITIFALGAVNRPGPVEMTNPHESLLEMLGQIAGLRDNLAAPRGVFVYRDDPKTQQQTVYRLDMASPGSFFIAQHFIMKPRDVLYVSDAPIANVTKVLQTIGGISSIAGIPRNFGASY